MTDSDSSAAPASAEGWLRRCVGVAGPFAGSQSMRNPPEMTERVSALDAHRVGPVRAPSAQATARGGRWLAFSGLAVDVTTLVDRGLLLLRPGPLEAAGMREEIGRAHV